jgi:ribosomal-protein-alanine N-acetyltransferase
MKLDLHTTRLHLRPAGAADLEALHRLWTDPDVRRHLFDDRALSLDEARSLLERSDAGFAERSLGLWCADERAGEALVGFAGFLHSDGEPDLVYGLHPSHWGRGLATEAARRVTEHAFSSPAAERVVASVDEPNQASIRVLERLGMHRTRRSMVDGKPLLYYARERDRG